MSAADGTPPGQVFGVELRHEDATVIASLHGELDMTGTEALEAALEHVSTGRCILDLRDLSFLDSSGIHVLMRLDTRSRAQGWSLMIAGPTGVVARALDLCRVGDRIRVVDDLPESS
jgi:anti-sigma B factor antagonist